jgi:DNA-binding IclR family transcriptional regulator
LEDVKDRQYVTALARGLEILRCFSDSTPVLGTSEIARLTKLPQATVWRLCHTLIAEGYLVQLDRKDKLRPGIPVLSLGFSVVANTPVAELARPAMEEIAVRHQGAVSLGARDGLNMIYLQRCQGSAIVWREMGIGSKVPLLSSVTGWAYLAGLPEPARKVVLDELRSNDPEGFKVHSPKIAQALENYSSTGYVINLGSLHPQINAVGVPVVAEDGSNCFSLSSGGLVQLFDEVKLREVGLELKKLASQLGIALKAGRKP